MYGSEESSYESTEDGKKEVMTSGLEARTTKIGIEDDSIRVLVCAANLHTHK